MTFKAVMSMITAFFTLLPQILQPIAYVAFEERFFEEWSNKQTYTEDYAIVLEKDPNEEFVVLNLADVQLSDDEYYSGMGAESEAMITKLIEEKDPDLITLSGDNAWGTLSYINLINFLDSFDIPWAPAMGNHDGEETISEFWVSYLLDKAENCLFKFGPRGLGYGNYIINIEENGKVIHSLIMMDTHGRILYYDDYGNENRIQGHLWRNQIEWYEWAVKGIEQTEGHEVESSVIMHVPVYPIRDVWQTDYDKENHVFTGEYAEGSFGVINEAPSKTFADNHFMDKVLELGGTKNIIFGHQHKNSASFLYNGVRLTYSLKLGKACYYDRDLQGGTLLKIANGTGEGTIEHVYVTD